MFPGARPFCRLSVWPSDRLDRKEVLCRVRYQYRGHLSRPKSLVGIFRQVTTLKSDRIVRFAQKTQKKFYPKKETDTDKFPSEKKLSRKFFFRISRRIWQFCRDLSSSLVGKFRQVTRDAISDLCTDTVRHKYPVARPDRQTDVRTDICVHTSASPSAADKNIAYNFKKLQNTMFRKVWLFHTH